MEVSAKNPHQSAIEVERSPNRIGFFLVLGLDVELPLASTTIGSLFGRQCLNGLRITFCSFGLGLSGRFLCLLLCVRRRTVRDKYRLRIRRLSLIAFARNRNIELRHGWGEHPTVIFPFHALGYAA